MSKSTYSTHQIFKALFRISENSEEKIDLVAAAGYDIIADIKMDLFIISGDISTIQKALKVFKGGSMAY